MQKKYAPSGGTGWDGMGWDGMGQEGVGWDALGPVPGGMVRAEMFFRPSRSHHLFLALHFLP